MLIIHQYVSLLQKSHKQKIHKFHLHLRISKNINVKGLFFKIVNLYVCLHSHDCTILLCWWFKVVPSLGTCQKLAGGERGWGFQIWVRK